MSFKNVKEVFDSHVKAPFDKRTAVALFQYVQDFLNKNETHTNFFGSGLVGVYPVRYVTSDATRLVEDVLEIEDIRDLQEDIYNLDAMDREFKVASDVTNLAFMYAIHRLMNAKIDSNLKRQSMVYVAVGAIAKHLTSLLTRRFKFNASPEIAMALYEALDNKTDLKYYGTWLNLLLARGEQLIDPKAGIFAELFVDFDDDVRIIYLTGEIRNRMRKTLNVLTEKFHDLKDAQGRILSQSAVTEIDGTKILKEYSRRERALVLDMEEIAKDEHNFIRDELVELTVEVISTSEERYLRELLGYYTDNFKADERLKEAQGKLITYVMFEAKHSRLSLDNIPEVVGRIRSIFRSSRTRKNDVLEIKKLFNEITAEGIPRARDSVRVASSIAFVIYIVLRLLTIPRYRQ